MNSIAAVLSALIIAAAVVAGGFLAGGRYAVAAIQGSGNLPGPLVYEVDKFTGGIRLCFLDDKGFSCFHGAANDLSETAR
jgi:hypothetical protein